MFLWLTLDYSMTSSHYMAGHGGLGSLALQRTRGVEASAHLPAWATHGGSVYKKERGFTFITAAYP